MSRLILYLIILAALYWVVKRIFSPATKRRAAKPEEASEEMVQDPHCRCYIPKSQSYAISLNGKKIFFCSQDCCHKYLASKSLPKA